MAKVRCALNGTQPATGVIDLSTFKRIFSKWHVWVLLPTYLIYAWGVQSYNVRLLANPFRRTSHLRSTSTPIFY